MRRPSLLKDYSKYSDNNLEHRAEAVMLSLNGNLNFPATVPTLANFTTIKEAFSTALEGSIDGGRTPIAIKNYARGQLLEAMRQLALNVESLAPGDRARLTSSGFELGSEGESAPPIEAPKNFVISNGINAGEIKLSVQGVQQAVSYVHEYTEDPVTPESKWTSRVSSSREYLFTGLQSGIRIHGRTAVIGRKGQQVYSPVLARVVQ